jgi:hypothetical protein
MIVEPIVTPAHQAEPPVQHTTEGLTQPEPSAQKQRLADDVFTDEQGQVVAALLAAQTGLGVLHHLTVETFQRSQERTLPPRNLPRPDEDKNR